MMMIETNEMVLTGEIVEAGEADIESQEWYTSLIDDCKAIITEARFTSKWALIEGYHQLGRRIVSDGNFQKYAKGNRNCLTRVSNNVGVGERDVYRSIQFYEKYPDLSLLPLGKNASWKKVIALLPAPKEDESKNPTPDATDELLQEWNVKPGQVWVLGDHRVFCGDAYDLAVEADALITDPPYGIGYKPDWNKWNGSPSDFSPVIGDDEQFDPSPFLSYPTVAMFGANYFSNRLPVGGWICWDKRLDESKDQMFGSPFELAWFRSVNTTKKAIMIRVLHGGVVNADSAEGNNEKRLHTTQKPVAVMQEIIEALTLPGDTVLDPFAGSGSTLLACENTGRTCVSIEIDPAYVAVILQRWFEKKGVKPWLA